MITHVYQANLVFGAETSSEPLDDLNWSLALQVVVRFTVRNITVNNAQIGVYSLWNWGKFGCKPVFWQLI